MPIRLHGTDLDPEQYMALYRYLEDKKIDFEKLAEITEGYAASDIKAIYDKAVKIPWKEALSTGEGRKLTMDDFTKAIAETDSSLTPWFKQAQKELKLSGEEDLFKSFADYILKYGGGVDAAKKTGITFEDVGDMEGVKEEIRNMIIYPLRRPDLGAARLRKNLHSKSHSRRMRHPLLQHQHNGCCVKRPRGVGKKNNRNI